MDRSKLKQTLRDQVVPMHEAVLKKLAYLSNDNVFSANEDVEDDDFAELLSDSNMPHKMQQTSMEPATTIDKIAVHKKSLAEKIAALRGISSPVPNSYINRKF